MLKFTKYLQSLLKEKPKKAINEQVPIQTKDLQQEIANSTLQGVRGLQYESISAQMTPSKLAATIRSICDGDAIDYLTLAEEMEERDPHYRSVLSVRKGTVASLEPTISIKSEDKKLEEIAEDLRELVATPEFGNLLFDLVDGLAKGYSVVEIIWESTNSKWTPKSYIWRDPRFFKKDALGQYLRLRDDNIEDGIELTPYKFIQFIPKLKSGLALRGGLALLASWSYVFKSYTLKDWLAFTEAYGMPLRLGKYGTGSSEEDKRTLLKAVASIGSDMGAIIPESMQIEFIQGANAATGESIYKTLADWLDSQLSKAVLGQTMTTDNGSSRSQSETHDKVRKDILRSDARQLAHAISRDLLIPYIDLNYGKQDIYPAFSLVLEEKEDINALVENISKLAPLGLQVSQAEILAKLGLKVPQKDDIILEMKTAISGQAQPILNRFNPSLNMALNKGKSDIKELDLDLELGYLEEELNSDWQKVASPLISPVEKLVAECNNFDELLERLPELAGEIDASELMRQLGLATFKVQGLENV